MLSEPDGARTPTGPGGGPSVRRPPVAPANPDLPMMHGARVSTRLPAMRSPVRIIALLAVAAIAVLAAVVMRRSFQMPVRSAAESSAPGVGAGEPGAGQEEDDGEDVVGRALRLAAIDSTKKTAWVDEIPDLELAALSPAARATFLRIANGRRCGCGCGFTLAGCRRFDNECEVSGPRAQALYDSVSSGLLTRADDYPMAPAVR